jgi:tetratricopeptide (TPR) repeat protein
MSRTRDRFLNFLFVVVCAAIFMSSTWRTHGRYALWETVQVPIGRILTNLEAKLTTNTNDVQTLYELARVHSMAFATNAQFFEITTNRSDPTAEDSGKLMFDYPGSDIGLPHKVVPPNSAEAQLIARRHLTNAIEYYRRARVLVLEGTNATAHRWLISPIHLGFAWCLDQAGKRDEAINAYRQALSIAWDEEVRGEFNLKEWAAINWQKIRAGQRPSVAMNPAYLSHVCYSEEIIGYLLKLLDPKKDANEIARLKRDLQTLAKMGRIVTPIIVPVTPDADLDKLIDRNARVLFDLDGTGILREWQWTTPKAAWLVYDVKGRGKITSALQMFGSVTFWIFWRDGYEALSVLDDNGDGVLRGPELENLALWHDANSNGISEAGEVRSLAEWGIISVSCQRSTHPSGIAWNPGGIEFSDGTTRPSFDWIAAARKSHR